MPSVNVIKASGEIEPFDEKKLRRSLLGAGADQLAVDEVVKYIHSLLYEGIPTAKIYKEAFRRLKQSSDRYAGRYKLKEAIMELGPTGYPFEKFVGEMLARLGYETEVGRVVDGDCVSHEIDVIAEKDDEHFMVECKFHNRKGHKCDVKIPLYIQSRFKDMEKKWRSMPGHKSKKHLAWVVTNTRFTVDALTYGQCVGLKMLSWDYPEREGLKDLISRANLHPITSLSSLTKHEKRELLKQDVLFCNQLCENTEILNRLHIDTRKQGRILKEAKAICTFDTDG